MKDEPSKELLVAAIRERCRVLGPGERFCVWVQGCPFCCKGCIAQSMRSLDGGYFANIEDLSHKILKTEGIEGITISGGEPFLQAEELAMLLEVVKKEKNLGVIVYTGFYYEKLIELRETYSEIGRLLSMIDLLIDGPYEEKNNLDYGMKGSVNQRTILLTDRYQDSLELYNNPESARKNELYQYENQTFLIGVPSKKVEKQWKKMQCSNDFK